MESLFEGNSVKSKRIIYTPSSFAKSNLLHLQEVGELSALKPHSNSREGLESFLLFVVTDGTGTLVYDNETYQLKKGNCVFIDCRKPYSQSSSEEQLWSLQWVHFDGFNAGGIYEKYVERGGLPAFMPENSSAFSEVLNDIFKIADSDDYIRDMKINEKLNALLTLIMAESWHPERIKFIGTKKNTMHFVKRYLDANYTEKFSLEHLAETFYINKFYLTRAFKGQYGITLRAYLEEVRITHAKQLLRFSDMTIDRVAREVGFDGGNYFDRVFKKVEGITPKEYREMWE